MLAVCSALTLTHKCCTINSRSFVALTFDCCCCSAEAAAAATGTDTANAVVSPQSTAQRVGSRKFSTESYSRAARKVRLVSYATTAAAAYRESEQQRSLIRVTSDFPSRFIAFLLLQSAFSTNTHTHTLSHSFYACNYEIFLP